MMKNLNKQTFDNKFKGQIQIEIRRNNQTKSKKIKINLKEMQTI